MSTMQLRSKRTACSLASSHGAPRSLEGLSPMTSFILQHGELMGCTPSSRIVPVCDPAERGGGRLDSNRSTCSSNTGGGARKGQKKDSVRLKIAREILQDYAVVGLVGKGAFSCVLQVKERDSEQAYALKVINRRSYPQNQIEAEIAILRRLSHPNVLSLHHLHTTKTQVYIITDLAEGGDLFDWLLKHGRFSEPHTARFIQQTLKAVQYLHQCAIIHRDVKLENILIYCRSYDTRLMLGDFGLAHMFETGVTAVLQGPCGTLAYQPPEALSGCMYSYPVDMWAVGVVAYTLLLGRLPFDQKDHDKLLNLIIAGKYDTSGQTWQRLSLECKAFLSGLLCADPQERMTDAQALEHSWTLTNMRSGELCDCIDSVEP